MNKLAISIILSVLITAIVIGGGVYVLQISAFCKEKQQLQQQIDSLNNQITQLSNQEKQCIAEDNKGLFSNNDECCSGLNKVSNEILIEGDCIGTYDGSFYCVNCGDNTCGWYENSCRCPQDCKESDTRDWQTYRNEVYGIEFKYPDYSDYSNSKIQPLEDNNLIKLCVHADRDDPFCHEIYIYKKETNTPPEKALEESVFPNINCLYWKRSEDNEWQGHRLWIDNDNLEIYESYSKENCEEEDFPRAMYFGIYDENREDSVYFISIGQDSFLGDDLYNWLNTIEFID